MKKVYFLCMFLILAPFSLFANPFDKDALAQMANSFDLDREQISSMIDLLHQTGQINAKQAAEAKKQLNEYSDDDIQGLKNQAIERIQNASSKEELMPAQMLQNSRQDSSMESTPEIDESNYQEILRSLE